MFQRPPRIPPKDCCELSGETPDDQHGPGREKSGQTEVRPTKSYDFKAAATVEPMSAGDSTVWMPAAAIAAYLSFAVPWPPLMIAPAWPMRRPGGAVWPAMKPTTGFFTLALIHSAARSSALPPISPIIMIACVSGSL